MKDLIAALEAAPEGSEELDVAICKAIYHYGPDDPLWHVLPYSRDLGAALTLVPEGWWWHLSHLSATVLPAGAINGFPVSNATFYENDGRPVRFESSAYERVRIPTALCCAALKARRALALPTPIPRNVYGKAIALLRKRNPEAKWNSLEYQHKTHWISLALSQAEATP